MTKVIFFGTPEYVVPVVETLNSGFELVATVTQPPRPTGRKQTLTPSPVALWSKENNIPNIDGEPAEVTSLLKEFGAEVGVLAAYGKILPAELLSLFPKGIINIHPSLLPKWRGPAPVEATIASGSVPGITIIKLDEEMDHGPVLQQTEETLEKSTTKEEAVNYMFKKAADYLPNLLSDYLAGNTKMVDQNHKEATFTKLLKKEDGFIDPKTLAVASQGETLQSYGEIPIRWMRKSIKKGDVFSFAPTPEFLERFIRAMSPWPGAWTLLRLSATEGQASKRLKLLKAHLEEGKLVLDEVQLEGKDPVSWKQFKAGYPSSTF